MRIFHNELRMALIAIYAASVYMSGCTESHKHTPRGTRLCEAYNVSHKQVDPSTKEGYQKIRDSLSQAISSMTADELTSIVQRIMDAGVATLCADCGIQECSVFESATLDALIVQLMRDSNRSLLVDFIASDCPDFIGQSPIEYELALGSEYHTLQDGVIVLLDAMPKATGENSDRIVRAAERAFAVYVPVEDDRNQWSTKCRAWWENNKHNLAVNYEYPSHVMFEEKITKANGLFLPK